MAEVLCVGIATIDLVALDSGSPLDSINSYVAVPGGSSANVAVGVSKLGVTAGFIGKVGNDPFGTLLSKTLEQYGVDIEGLKFTSEARTCLVFISKRDGNLLFYRNPGADMLLTNDDIDESLFSNASLFHYDSVCMTGEPSVSAIFSAVEYAEKHGLFISFDVNYRTEIWKDPKLAKDRIRHAMSRSHLVKLTIEELEFLFETKDMEKGSQKIFALKDTIEMVVLTAGEQGSFVYTDKVARFVKAKKVPIVDTCGCGDAFAAAIISNVVKWKRNGKHINDVSSDDLKFALVFANAAGGLTATKKGVIPVLPTHTEINEFLHKAN